MRLRGWSTRWTSIRSEAGPGGSKRQPSFAPHIRALIRDFLSFECGARDRDRACLERWALDDDMRQSVSRADPLHFPPTLSRYLVQAHRAPLL